MNILIISATKNNEKTINFFNSASKKNNARIWLYKAISFEFDPSTGFSISYGKERENIDKYDAVILKHPRYRIKGQRKKFNIENQARIITDYCQKKGIKILNGDAILQMPFYNKLSQHYFFGMKRLPVIPTLHLINPKFSFDKLAEWDYPAVFKNSFGSLGKQVFKIKNEETAKKFVQKNYTNSFLIQKLFQSKCDYRILMLGRKTLGAIKRTAGKNQWRANFALGANVEKIEPSKEMISISKKVQKAVKADFVGVDLIEYKNKFYVLEANLYPHFEGLESVHPKLNVADEVINFLKSK